MNRGGAGNKAIVSAGTTSGNPDGTPQQKICFAPLHSASVRRIRAESVTTSVSTQTGTSYLRDIQEHVLANKSDLFVVCTWCRNFSKNFSTCEVCKSTIEPGVKPFVPQTLRLNKSNPQTPTSPAIAAILPQQTQTTILLTTHDATAATTLLATPTVIKAGQFYGHPISIQSPATTTTIPTTPTRVLSQTLNGASKVLVLEKPSTLTPTATPVRRYRGKKKAEPECLTISSDEDENQVPPRSTHAQSDLLNTSLSKDTSIGSDDNATNRTSVIHVIKKDNVDTAVIASRTWSESGDKATDEDTICIQCRSIRIGSYKVQAYDPQALSVVVTAKEIRFTVTCIEGKKIVNISLQKDDIPSVLGHFGKVLPVLFIYTTPGCASSIRTQLNMTDKEKPYYDPCNPEECKKRITILPYQLVEQQKLFLSKVFPGTLLAEIKQAAANEILIRSTPVHGPKYLGINLHKLEARGALVIAQPTPPKVNKEVIKLVTYPPPPQTGGIEINSEDLECLKEGEFLNDVIIDFYLKYLMNEKLSPADKQQTHIFSSFFFPRLTTKNTDEETSINIIRRRHARVKTWTRHVDIFEKDFIIVPVNQNSHWFLAVICFPGMLPPPAETTVSNNVAKTTGNAGEEEEEEECEPSPSQESPAESPMDVDDQELPVPPVAPPCPMTVPLLGLDDEKPNVAVPSSNASEGSKDIGPCILIFDSLPGNQRWKVVQTLREYLTIEYEVKKKATRIFDRNTMRGMNVALLPRQENYTDCGIYLLQYVESFFESPMKKFSSPLPSLVKWFPDTKTAGKREELKELILSLQRQQQENALNRENAKSNHNQEKSV